MNSVAALRRARAVAALALIAAASVLAQPAKQPAGQSSPQPATQPAPQAAPQPALWWPGFIDARGKTFLELPDDATLCALARETLRRAAAEPGRVIALRPKVEALLPRGARLNFGVIDTQGNASERVMTRIVTIARGADKGACAHIAEAGADAPGYVAEEDRTAFGVHPPRPLVFRAPPEAWRSYGAVGDSGGSDARFAAAAAAPPAWRARVNPLIAQPQEIYGQPFVAVLQRGAAAQRLLLTGAIAQTPEFDTLNLIVRADSDERTGSAGGTARVVPGATLYRSGPSGGVGRNRSGSFAAQVAGTIDLDGDGVDEIILRARYYSGGNLRILRLVKGRLIDVRASAYEGE